MGLTVAILDELVELKQRGLIDRGARVAEIGQQQLSDSFLSSGERLDEVFRLFGAARVDLGSPVGAEDFTARAPLSRTFWRALGFDYVAIDLAGDDVVRLDLNRDAVPQSLRHGWDLVVNGGTTEHIANQDNAFRCIHDLAKSNGIMIHGLPCQGLVTHGLIHYTPKFFWHLSRVNHYEELSLALDVGQDQPMPQNVADFGIHFGKRVPLQPQDRITFRNCWLRVMLRKPHDRPFVTPLDAV
jgi:hypothetical protein